MLKQDMRIVSQRHTLNLPYNLISVFKYKSKIYARTITGREYVLGTYSTEEKAEYIFGQILCWSQNTYFNYFELPKDEKVDLSNLD